MTTWWVDAEALRAEQVAVAQTSPPHWSAPEAGELVAIGCFVAFALGSPGLGRAGDRAWIGVAVWSERAGLIRTTAMAGAAGAPYTPGLLAMREAALVFDAVAPVLPTIADTAEPVVLIDATGRDHPRRAGMALHIGHLLGVPTVGITHRPLVAARAAPVLDRRGRSRTIHLDGEVVAAWVCTADHARPVVAHAGWRTDVDTAVEVALRTSLLARTPEPLRLARQRARLERAATT